MIAEFVRILKRANVLADEQSIADVLWLAPFLPPPPTHELQLPTPGADQQASPASPGERRNTTTPAARPLLQDHRELRGDRVAPPRMRQSAGGLYPALQRSRPVAPIRTSALRVPAATALPHGLEI